MIIRNILSQSSPSQTTLYFWPFWPTAVAELPCGVISEYLPYLMGSHYDDMHTLEAGSQWTPHGAYRQLLKIPYRYIK